MKRFMEVMIYGTFVFMGREYVKLNNRQAMSANGGFERFRDADMVKV